ncbi:hypothetical protein BD410DRAFT_897166 [Rickenella mellea]|uniref:Uncharacterized protein n=1 Tax=Rickenella mellea TaxID=50990 RepID=A0A4Y7Q9I2_9AGAM|nr:hypothetical protein BD410DRAFT_897166 [Rickenella mellea]
MDDPWSNAWSEPAKPELKEPKETGGLGWSTTTETKTNIEDVGPPSWTTGSVSWTDDSVGGSLWAGSGDDTTLDGWKAVVDAPSTSTFAALQAEDITSDTTSVKTPHELPPETNITSPNPAVNVPLPFSPPPERSPPPEPITRDSPLHVPVTLHEDTPDPFGSFESGTNLPDTHPSSDEFVWSPAAPTFDASAADGNAWGTVWAPAPKGDAGVKDDTVIKDEWEVAKERKENLDKTMPPEVLAGIMGEWATLSSDLWPEEPNDERGNGEDFAMQEGLSGTLDNFLPQTLIHPPINFIKSHTAKAMANGVKLSRNLPLAKSSPMSHLFATRGSSAWEQSVKNRVEVVKDDLPVGWRIVEQTPVAETKSVEEKKGGGLLSSLFGRRNSTMPTASTSKEVSSTEPSKTSSSRSNSPRPSGDVRSSTDVARSPALSSMPSASASPVLASLSKSTPPTSPIVPSLPSPTKANVQTHNEESSNGETPAAPSVVSRFLNRFSRTKSEDRPRSASPRGSMSLSSDDLAFLSDIVPTHNEHASPDDMLKGLTSMIESAPLPTKLPPPLPPPPSVPRAKQSLPPPPLPKKNGTVGMSNPLDDLESLFGSVAGPSGTTSTTVSPMIPTSLSPPPSSTVLTPTPLSDLFAISTAPLQGSSTSPPLLQSPGFRANSPSPLVLTPRPLSTRPETPRPRSPYATSARPITPAGAGSIHLRKPSDHTTAMVGPSSQISASSAILTPPPPSRQPLKITPLANPVDDDDDDFSDFHSSNSFPTFTSPDTAGTTPMKSAFESPSRGLLSRHGDHAADSFGDFGEFASSSPMRSPSPPRPPKKSALPLVSPEQPVKPGTHEQQRSLELVQNAAARPGRWPREPSPVTPMLPPPPMSPQLVNKVTNGNVFDIMDDYSLHGGSGAKPPGPRTSSPSAFPILPPPIPPQVQSIHRSTSPPFTLPPPPLSLFASPPSRNDAKPPVSSAFSNTTASNSSSNNPRQTGGLSAQDLSFFEGL